MIRDDILAQAQARQGMPYRLDPPPDGVNNLDCSLFVLKVFEAAGIPFGGVRTAEQIRQASVPIDWGEVEPGDLLFFEDTYDADESPGPDGHLATHIGISLGSGTFQMWDANEVHGVGQTNINTPFWQEHIFEARRAPALVDDAPGPIPDGTLSMEPEHRFSFEDLRPTIEDAAREFGTDPGVVAGILYQESGFRNYRVHNDGTGHGLVGLDDNGLLPDFERWSGLHIGRGANAAVIPPESQIRYLAKMLADWTQKYGDAYAGARAWHRGEGLMNDARGQQYEQLIRTHAANLYATVQPDPPSDPPPDHTPDPPAPVEDVAALQARIADLEDQVAALQSEKDGLVIALADVSDRIGDAIYGYAEALKGQVEQMRNERQQFIGPRA